MLAGETLLNADPPLPYPTCFHAQQAVEKYFKALLTSHQLEFPKTHDITKLLDLVNQVDSETAALLKESAILTPFGVDIRYPGEQQEPDIREASDAFMIAKNVRKRIIQLLNHKK